MILNEPTSAWLRRILSVLFAVVCLQQASGLESVCARIVIQIEQQVTLEREGFEARLGISNGLPTALTNLRVTLNFLDANNNPVVISTDSAPNSSGKFYYRLQTGYSVVDSVASGATAKIAYLIVPTLGAAGDSAQGTLYYVGATVKYISDGVEQTEEIAPDYVYVRPMPLLQLQYFLPGQVYGDDPLTTGIVEPIVPFPLGVRVINHSAFATAKGVKIESAQPEIIDNQQGLLETFEIIGCRVNNLATQPSLLVDFGDILPQHSAIATWRMTTSLSGKFVKFSGEVSHAPEFGGELTSLIPADAISTHRLIGQVVVDLTGRDNVPDFLATDTMAGDITAPRIYESDTEQVSQSVDYFAPGNAAVTISYDGTTASLAVTEVAPIMYVRATSPVTALKRITVKRSDGKILPPANAWIDKIEDASGNWTYWLNLFDTGKGADQTYSLTFSEPPAANQPPTLTIIGGPSFLVAGGQTLSVGVVATDPDGTVPTLASGALPFGAAFVDQGEGKGLLTWTPTLAQLGNFTVQFKAADETTTATANAFITVAGTVASTYQSWEQSKWPLTQDPEIVGPTANPDLDQLDNLLEYALDSDPTKADVQALPKVGVVTIDGLRYLTLTYQKRTNDPTLRYEVIGANAANAPEGEWVVQTQSVLASQANISPGIERVTVRDSVAVENAPRRYLKLRVTQTGNP